MTTKFFECSLPFIIGGRIAITAPTPQDQLAPQTYGSKSRFSLFCAENTQRRVVVPVPRDWKHMVNARAVTRNVCALNPHCSAADWTRNTRARRNRANLSQMLRVTRVRMAAKRFHGLFYGLRNFCCKTAQCCATPCESEMAKTPSIRNTVQHSENVRNSLGLN